MRIPPSLVFVAAAWLSAGLLACDRAPSSAGSLDLDLDLDAGVDAPALPSTAAPPGGATAARAGSFRAAPGRAQAWSASHRGFGFDTVVDREGAHLTAPGGAWSSTLRLDRLGRAGATRRIATPTPTLRGARVELEHGGGVREWFEHGVDGLEHGVDLRERVPGEGLVELEVTLDGAHLEPGGDGRSAAWLTPSGARLRYGQLRVRDAGGRELEASMAAREGRVTLTFRDEGAAYPIVVDPLVFGVLQSELLPGDGAANDQFGSSVALDGTTALVGAPGKVVGMHSCGVAYVYGYDGAAWVQQAELVPSDPGDGDWFGISVALHGTTAIVGAYAKVVGANNQQGAVYVFEKSGGVWTQQTKLLTSDGAQWDGLGGSLAFDGTTLLAGAAGKSVSTSLQGAAYVFTRSGATWAQGARLVASDPVSNDQFGTSLAFDGTTALIAAPEKNFGGGLHQGAVYVFDHAGGSWTQRAQLRPSDTYDNDQFGTSLAIVAGTAVIGAPYKYVGSNNAQGAAYVFGSGPAGLVEQAILHASDGASMDLFGQGVAFDGTTILVGANFRSVGANANQGAAYTFAASGGGWAQQTKLLAADGGAGDELGYAVALQKTFALVGARNRKIGASDHQGAAYVFVEASALGDGCKVGADCVSGFCADGVCCDSACVGTCHACTAAGKSGGGDGRCGLAANGNDPRGDCPRSCSGSSLLTIDGCDGAGACKSPVATSCLPFACSAGACRTTCASDASCDLGAFCDGTTCTPKRARGVACSAANQCATGACVEGVCCDGPCTGKCRSCRAGATGGTDGVCASVTAGTDPHADCPGVACASETLIANTCDGSGGCKPAPTSCLPYRCAASGAGCATSCTVDGDCGTGSFCKGGACAARLANGAACSTSNQCSSSFCVDGVCCETKCDGSCQACDGASSAGSCVAILGAPRNGRQACAGTGTCAGTCNGTSSACTYPEPTTTCDVGCVGAKRSACDGKGACVVTSCPDELVCADARSCKSSCAADADCVEGYGCTAGACAPKAARCSDDGVDVLLPDATAVHCTPFRCKGNACLQRCVDTTECLDGFRCDDNKECVPVAPAAAAAGGCSQGAGRTSTSGLAGLLLIAGVVARRARRARRRTA